MNKVILIGRLVKAPELRMTQSGTKVCSFCVACDRRYEQNGEHKADFINCVAWRQTAEFVAAYFKKGNRIALEGSLQVRSWEDDSGTKRYATEVLVEHAEFCEKKSEGTQGSTGQTNGAARFDSFDEYDDLPIDFPF